MTIRIPTRVVKLEEKQIITHGKKDATGTAVLTSQKIGWFVNFEGSYESLFVGSEKPKDLEPGTEVDIIIRPRKARP